MAVERSSQKELEEMRSKLEDLNEELEDLRGQQQSGSSVEDLVALKKEAAMDQSRLEDQIRALQAEVQRRSDEVQRLQANVDNLSERLQQKEDELERAVSEAQLKVMNPGGGDESVTIALRQESRQLQQHVADLTAQLERALAAQAEAKEPVPSSTSDEVFVAQRKIRQMERELAGLKRDKAALEDDLDKNDQILAAKDREIMQLRRNVPLPSSRPSTPEPAHGDDMADERIAMLVNDCDQLRELEKELRQRIAEQDGQIREAGENLAKSRAQIAKMTGELEAAQWRLEVSDTASSVVLVMMVSTI
jgi:chromosome segregation protein